MFKDITIARSLVLILALGLMLFGGVCWLVGSKTIQSRMDASPMQCGHFALLRTCQLLGVIVSDRYVLELMPPKSMGHSFTDLKFAAERMNLRADGFVEDWESLLAGEVPAILQLRNPGHFVVLSRTDDDRSIIFDDLGHRRLVPASFIRKRWTGAILRIGKRSYSKDDVRRSNSEGSPQIEFDTLLLDKGEVSHGVESLKYDFSIRNIGSGHLKIDEIKVSCSCLSTEFPSVIEPRGSGIITLTYHPDSGGESLLVAQDALVITNDPRNPRVRISALASVESRVVVFPRQIKFGPIPNGETARAYAVAYYRGEEATPFKLALSKALPKGVTFRSIENDEYVRAVGPKGIDMKAGRLSQKQYIEISIDPTVMKRSSDRFSGTLLLKSNIPKIESVGIPYSGMVAPAVEALPSLLAFELRDDAVARVRLKAPREFAVTSCSEGTFATTEIQAKADNRQHILELEVRLPAERARELHGNPIRLTTKDMTSNYEESLELKAYVRRATGLNAANAEATAIE